MPHHYKISTETYLKIFRFIEENDCTVSMAVQSLGIDVSPYWAKKKYKAYKRDGIDAIRERLPRSYSNEFKLKVVREALKTDISMQELANKHGIPSVQSIRLWVKNFQAGKEFRGFNSELGGDRLARKTTLNERVMIAEYYLKHDNNYKETARIFNVNSNQVRRWVKRFKENGEEGLVDGRGRGKPKSVLTEEEKKELEWEALKKRNEFLEMENEVLKKEREIERRLMNRD